MSNKTILSHQVCLCRNLADLPFEHTMTEFQAEQGL